MRWAILIVGPRCLKQANVIVVAGGGNCIPGMDNPGLAQEENAKRDRISGPAQRSPRRAATVERPL